eukprot:CAMPEP_0202690744 /NCGR_PEP_ID=MMETSP1385-20130828/5637_1 /ASSEMBLY_ACC=CAM_ASM_000861 /TAXON_ID=933848 /ORGANISM="Elphidium margaritaceum" /LENGTH=678 /DNA_ID=CAMNT_0049346035 /DNA_START=44 /DNA_END=2080 /DNA_ORIENTATION=+
MSLNPFFARKLHYLLTVGYTDDIIETIKSFCLTEVFDEVAVMDDLEDILDSAILEHLQQKYEWSEEQLSEFYTKLRQALLIEPKPQLSLISITPSISMSVSLSSSLSSPCGPGSSVYLPAQASSLSVESKSKSRSKCFEYDATPPSVWAHDEDAKQYDRDSEYSPPDVSPNVCTQLRVSAPSLSASSSSPSSMYVCAESIDHTLTPYEWQAHKQAYAEQCTRLLPSDQRNGDEAMVRALAIGRKNKVPLLQNIADTYSRVRINEWCNSKLQANPSELSEAEFFMKYKYFRALREHNQTHTVEYLQSALHSFQKRICPKIHFKSMLKINDSLPEFFEYTSAAIKFVHNSVQQHDALPPFQIDFWIIPKNVTPMSSFPMHHFHSSGDESTDDDDDDTDEEDDDNSDFEHSHNATSIIGDIEARLRHEKLLYMTSNVEFNSPLKRGVIGQFQRELDQKCRRFWRLQQQQQQQQQHSKKKKKRCLQADRTGAHKTRICILVDRRSKDGGDEHGASSLKSKPTSKKVWEDAMYIFSPPNNCNQVSDAHVPESFFNASKECMLPLKGYKHGQGKKHKFAADGEEHIDVGHSVDGYQFTLSFHVEAVDDIKCYLFHQGWMTRFLPQDMIEIWPGWFEKSKENLEFVQNSKLWRARINALRSMLNDSQFEQWYEDTTKRTDLFKTY